MTSRTMIAPDYLGSLESLLTARTGSGRLNVRNLRVGERLPDELATGYNDTLDPDWVWIAEDKCGIQAVLLAAPFHGFVFLGRIVARTGAPHYAVTLLTRQVFRVITMRGYNGVFSWLDLGLDKERKVSRILHRRGGKTIGGPHVLVVNRTSLLDVGGEYAGRTH